jgi:acetate CoA/acetoacetate CoA-transferase alpha subunit
MKPCLCPEDVAAAIPDGASLMIGGFMGVGSPHRVIEALCAAGRTGLTVIANDAGKVDYGVGRLVREKRVARMIVSHIGLNPEAQAGMNAGEIAMELVPQGTLAERIRAAGCGLGGVLTRTGLGTIVAEGARVIDIDGQEWLFAPPLRAEFALIAAEAADHGGNLSYELTATNFNPLMAMAADEVIAEPRRIVPIGVIPPDAVRTPGVLVDRLVARPRDSGRQ